jgi:hypothetical protein
MNIPQENGINGHKNITILEKNNHVIEQQCSTIFVD